MRLGEDLGAMTADARKVKQIVYNLLSNAVKFIADGGDVTLRADRVTRDDVGVLTAPWAGRTFPLAESDVLRISHAQRHGQRHRDVAGRSSSICSSRSARSTAVLRDSSRERGSGWRW